ncbi:MAG: GTP-binding protein [Burkholderiaceae bacterium]
MTSPRIPFIVIGGFLGAGKTTLLNHWLRNAAGQRLAVLVNDFGAINIDAGLIEANSGDTIALTNGCVCCQIGDDLSLALLRVLDSQRRFDGVVVEASGVSDPWRIAQLGRADPRLTLDAVIVLIDASSALAHARDPLLADTLVRQVRAADLIVINKTDLVGEAELSALRAWFERTAGAVAQIETTHAQLAPQLLSSAYVPTAQACGHPAEVACAHHAEGHAHDDPAHGAQFETWSCRPSRAFAPEELRAWLKAPPLGLLRLKGVLRIESQGDVAHWSEIQFAGRQGTLRAAPVPRDTAALVAIGLHGRLPVRALSTFFEISS